jgi:CO/xanthine dehydrogenase Mo-binding subunit
MMDKMAEQLGMNPLEFRLKNLIPPEMPHQDSGLPYSSNGIRECLEQTAEAIGFSQNWHAPGTRTLSDGRLHGIGITCAGSTFCGMWGAVGAIVNMTKDGKALITAGISRVGGGTVSAMCHIVAEQLGLPYEDVMVGEWGNTDVASHGSMQAGSSRTITLGAAFYNAAKDAKEQLFEIAAGLLEVPVEDITAIGGHICLISDPSQSVTHEEVCALGPFGSGTIIGKGYSWGKVLQEPVGDFPVGAPCENINSVATAVEVAVDPETGEVEILKAVNSDDPGRAIFRKGAEGQVEGGMEIQIGEALLYEQIFDPADGATLNPNFLNHRLPTTLDLHTDRHEVIIVESIDKCGPYGAHGMGEPPVQSYACIANAIYNATGEWIIDAPIYPQKILKSLGKA